MMKSFNPGKVAISATVALFSFGSIALLGAEAKAQYYPECFMTDEFGAVVDLSSICGYSAPQPESQESTDGVSREVVDDISQQGVDSVSREVVDDISQDAEVEESSTYIGERESETSSTETTAEQQRAADLYRGYQDVLRGSTPQNRQLFRDAAGSGSSGSRSR